MPAIEITFKDKHRERFSENRTLYQKDRGLGNRIEYETGFVKITDANSKTTRINADIIERIHYE